MVTAPARSAVACSCVRAFREQSLRFEQFAADLWAASERNVDKIDVTRPWRDGGRDAIGDYLIGPPSDPVAVEFALEAKCYAPGNSVGVRETSRLISRLRHRQFGVLVTTSHVDAQAYREIRDDGHPVVILAGRDVASRMYLARTLAREGRLEELRQRAGNGDEYARHWLDEALGRLACGSSGRKEGACRGRHNDPDAVAGSDREP